MKKSILKLNNVNIWFNPDDKVVKNVNLNIWEGESLALVGESGSGKSLTSLSSAMLLPESAKISGDIFFSGQHMNGLSDNQLQKIRGKDIGYIFQEPMTSLNPLHPVKNQVCEIIHIHQNVDKKKAEAIAKKLITDVGLDESLITLRRYPHQLSGGQRQRVMIAMSLANKPKLLIADEPTTALDATIEDQILILLKRLVKKYGSSLIFITHDLSIVEKIATHVAVMKDGEIVETGSVNSVLTSPKHPYTKKLIFSETTFKKNRKLKNAAEIFRAENISVSYPISFNYRNFSHSYIEAVKSVSFCIHEGETLGVVGESGSGKTSLGLAILRLIKFKGNTFLRGTPLKILSNKKLAAVRSKMQIIFQDPYGSLSPRMNIGEIILEGLNVHQPKLELHKKNDLLSKVLEEVGLNTDMISRFPHEFSGGQRQRIAIARALILKPSLLVLDEPTSSLDRTVQVQIIDLLHKIQADHKLAYIFISHDLRIIRKVSDKIMIMKSGEVVEHGIAEEIFRNPKNSYSQKLFSTAFKV